MSEMSNRYRSFFAGQRESRSHVRVRVRDAVVVPLPERGRRRHPEGPGRAPELRGLEPRQRGGVRHPRDGGRAHGEQQEAEQEEREGGHRRRDDDRPAKVAAALQVKVGSSDRLCQLKLTQLESRLMKS